jgi:hypothetical protein
MRRVVLGIALAVLLVGAAGSVSAQTRQVWVSVRTADGAPVTGLAPEQFSVVEDNVDCKTVKVEPIEWPIKLTVLVDNGGKSSEYLLNLRNALRGLFKAVPSGTETSLLTLAPQPRWVVRPTTDAQQLDKGIDLITPDPGAARFFEGLAEAADRAAKDKAPYFPVYVMVVSTLGGRETPIESLYQKLQRQLFARAATVHFVVLSGGSESATGVTGALQTNLGLQITQITGGRFENINSASRLDTLLPEIGREIADSAARQQHEYRITYEPPKGSKEGGNVGVRVTTLTTVIVQPSIDGHLP